MHAIQSNLNTPPTETSFDCQEFKISDPWGSLTEEQ